MKNQKSNKSVFVPSKDGRGSFVDMAEFKRSMIKRASLGMPVTKDVVSSAMGSVRKKCCGHK